MPTYEYVCAKCGHQFDKVQSMSDTALAICPKELCGRKKWGRGKVKRAIGTGAGTAVPFNRTERGCVGDQPQQFQRADAARTAALRPIGTLPGRGRDFKPGIVPRPVLR